MAFTRNTFSLVEGHASGTGSLRQRFTYETNDTVAAMLVDGYFDSVGSPLNPADTSATNELKDGDTIECWAENDQAVGARAYGLLIVNDAGTALPSDTSMIALIASTAY